MAIPYFSAAISSTLLKTLFKDMVDQHVQNPNAVNFEQLQDIIEKNTSKHIETRIKKLEDSIKEKVGGWEMEPQDDVEDYTQTPNISDTNVKNFLESLDNVNNTSLRQTLSPTFLEQSQRDIENTSPSKPNSAQVSPQAQASPTPNTTVTTPSQETQLPSSTAQPPSPRIQPNNTQGVPSQAVPAERDSPSQQASPSLADNLPDKKELQDNLMRLAGHDPNSLEGKAIFKASDSYNNVMKALSLGQDPFKLRGTRKEAEQEHEAKQAKQLNQQKRKANQARLRQQEINMDDFVKKQQLEWTSNERKAGLQGVALAKQKGAELGKQLSDRITTGSFRAFFLALVLAIIKDGWDIIDIFIDGGMLGSVVNIFVSAAIYVILASQLGWMKKILVEKMARRVIVLPVLEFIPGVEFVPFYTFMMLYIKMKADKERGKNVQALKKLTSILESLGKANAIGAKRTQQQTAAIHKASAARQEQINAK